MSDLLAEVDEAMRQERIEKFFKEHGKTVIAFIVLTIVLTGAISGYKHWNQAQKEKSTIALMETLNAADFPENTLNAELDMRGGLRGMALLSAGSAFLEQDKTEEAIKVYTRAADDKGIPSDFRQLAKLMVIRLDNSENAKPIDMLETIWSDKNSPWRFHARLEAASILANKDGDFESALEHLNVIQDAENLPDTLYNKARALTHIYALKQKKAADSQKADTDS